MSLKTEEDIKEYLENLHIEYKFGCHSEKSSEACHLLGDFEESIKKNFAAAAEMYKMNCDTYNYPRSCSKYGGYRLIGKSCKKDEKDAYKYIKKSCDLGHADGCVTAGMMATLMQKFNLNLDKTEIDVGVKMLQKACFTHNSEKGCYYLSGIYLTGIEGHVPKNFREAYKCSLKACEFGNPYACANISQMHARGEGAEKNATLAETFKQRAVELHNEIKNGTGMQFQQDS